MKPAPQHQYSTQTRGSKPVSQLHCSNQDATRSPHQYSIKMRGSKPASWYHCSLKSQILKHATWHHCSLKTQSLKPVSGRVRSPRLVEFEIGIWNARLEARVPTTEKLCVSVITVLITGSITAHVMRGVNPHYGGFLGDSFSLKTL